MQDSALQCTTVQCNTVQYIRAVNLSGQQCEESGSGGEHHLLHHCILDCTALHCSVLHCSELHCTALPCTTLHCTILQCTVAQYCTAEYIAGVIVAALPSPLASQKWPRENKGFAPSGTFKERSACFPFVKTQSKSRQQPNYGIIRVLDTTQIF